MEVNKQAYSAYIKEVTPTHSIWLNTFRAFLMRGIICTTGQAVLNWLASTGMGEKTAASWNLSFLIVLNILLTGPGIYPKIVKWAGVGVLVPIAGFANSIVTPTIEYKAEGQVLGINCKIFTIVGPVILYGVFSSWILGAIYWALQMVGIVGT